MKYAVVVPAKNEEVNIKLTIESVIKQTKLPEICLFVDDASTDSTPEIIKDYAAKYTFIKYYKISGKKDYSLGGHVIQVFNKGKEYVDQLGVDYDYIIKLDADLSFEADFIEKMSEKIAGGNWGVVSGTPYFVEGSKRIYDRSPRFHSRGQFKFYNKQFLDEINGVPLGLGWDTADNIKAIEKGFKTERFNDLDYEMLRRIGGKHSLKKGRIKHGMGAYNLDYSFGYLLLRVLHDFFKPPYITGALYFIYGYITSVFKHNPKILTKPQSKILRKLLWSEFSGRFKSKDFYILQKLSPNK